MTNETLKYYDNNAYLLAKRYENAEISSVWERIDEAFCSGEKVLEIGCGSGRDTAYMHEKGLDVFAIDGSFGLIKQALVKHPELTGRISQTILPSVFPFSDSSFEGIVSIACLMHFKPSHIREILTEICRVSKRKAVLVISVPSGRADVLDGKDDKGRTFTLLPIEAWKKIFLEFKFGVIDVQIKPDGLGRDGIEWATFTLKTA